MSAGGIGKRAGEVPGRYIGRFFTEGIPETKFPEQGMSAQSAHYLIEEEVALDGDPWRNLATFVTTWMEPEAQGIIAQNLHRNFIDHAEYPRTAEIERRCVRMLADLYNAPGETTGARCQGSSEAVMLGGLAAKWRWRKARGDAGLDTAKPNLVFGGDVHVVWNKFCRYFDVEPRTVPLRAGKYTIGPDDVESLVDENTIAVVAVLGTTFTGEADDVAGINELLRRIREERELDVALHVDAASGGFVWPFLYPKEPWDFRLEQVRSINVSGHKFGLVYPGIGWLVFRDASELPDDLVFYENYLGETEYDEFDVAAQLAAERGWMVPAYTLPPDVQDVTVMRALVKENVSHAAARTLADDIVHACETLDKKGSLHPRDRKRVKTGTGY